MLDLSTLKTWTDGLWAVISAPDIVVPLLVLLAIAVWLFRGMFERVRREGLQSIIDGRDAQIAGLNIQIAVARERLRLANDLQGYASTKFADAEKEAAKPKTTNRRKGFTRDCCTYGKLHCRNDQQCQCEGLRESR
ncbi:MAG TPA: hypothetical protein VE970_17805 [Pseudolabrys sp.]|nr:hypothetical protein [Pseudolabrys sp.]